MGAMDRKAAEITALKALAYLAGEAGAMARFLTISGLEPQELRARAGEPEMLAAVVDFLLADEPVLLGFCEAESESPASLHAARRALPGGRDGETG